MYSFSKISKQRLVTCHPYLIAVASKAIVHTDFTVVCGHRGMVEQNEAFRTGRSKVEYPNSKHNPFPSEAFDLAPYPIDWDDIERFRAFGGFILGMAAAMDIKMRWGGDWDGDWQFRDQRFIDLPHFELLLPETISHPTA